MSNRVYITPTEFKDVRRGEVSYGVLACDNEVSDYIDCWADLPESNREVLKRVIKDGDSRIADMLDYAESYEKCVYVGGEWFSSDDLRKCGEEVEREFEQEFINERANEILAEHENEDQ